MKTKPIILFLFAIVAIGCAKTAKTQSTENVQVTKIYNLVILDQSGSMMPLREVAVQGYNEILDVIRKAQNEHNLEQQNLVTLALFNHHLTKVFDCDTVQNMPNLLLDNYLPDGMTAMLDAIGISLVQLKAHLNQLENATAVVTIISDGMENASTVWDVGQVVALIDELKEQGVMFVFMGTNQNVGLVANALHIDEYMDFEYSAEGLKSALQRGMNASADYYERMSQYNQDTRNMSKEERNAYYRRQNEKDGWFQDNHQ